MAFQISWEIVCVKKYQKESSFFRENLGLEEERKMILFGRFSSEQYDCEIHNERNSEFSFGSGEQLNKHAPMRCGKIGCGVFSWWIFLKIFA